MSTLRKALDLKREGIAQAGESNRCYSSNPSTVTLRVHDPDGTDWLFSWTHFAHAKFTVVTEKQKLVLTFLSHEINFVGSNLGLICDAVARFTYVLSESDTGHAPLGSNTSVTEYFVTFYKPGKVSPATDLPHGFISSPRSQNPLFKRVPYAFAFRTLGGTLDFVLVSVHLEPTDRSFRAGEFRAISDWLQRQYSAQLERDLIVLGDCNLQSKAELTADTPSNFISLNADCVRTNVARGSEKPFDHVFFNPQYTTEIDQSFGFNVINLIDAMQPGHAPTTAEQNTFFQTYSDHHPVVFRFKIPAHDDDN